MEGSVPKGEEGETLQQQLDAFLAYAEGDVLLWHDPARMCAPVLRALSLPADVSLAREDELTPLQLKVLVEDVDLDERLLVYRPRYRDVSETDWLAGIEARAEWFAPAPDAVLPEVPQEPAPSDAERIAELPADAVLEPPAATSPDAAPAALPAEAPAASFPTETAYFDSLFQAGVVLRSDLPAEVLAKPSFKVFLSRRAMAGAILPYEEGAWITAAGMAELGIEPDGIAAFAEAALAAARSAGLPCFTVAALRGMPASADLPLLAYDFSDAFYAAALTSQRGLLDSARLCGARVFTPAGQSPRGRDVIEVIVRDAGSLYVDDLVHLLQSTYGIPIARSQLLALVKKTDLYLYQGVDKLYPSYEQFLREVE